MLPNLEFGPWQISTYKAIVVLAVMITGWYTYERLLKLDHPPDRIARYIIA